MLILAIDPGPAQSGMVLYRKGRIVEHGIIQNHDLLKTIHDSEADIMACEMISSYGMPVGKEIFDTCVWIGRFVQAWHMPDEVKLIYRRDIKMDLCGSARAKDPNVRRALIDLLGEQGTKKTPGVTYGIKSHSWAALAVAVCADRWRIK